MTDAKAPLKAVPVRRRSAARLAAVQLAYQGQMSGQSLTEFMPVFLQHYVDDIKKSFRVKDLDGEHLSALAAGVETGRAVLDEQLAPCLADGWTLDRLTEIDLAILRSGACELTSMPHLPARAVVSEYTALADACGCDVGFINAVLDRLARSARTVEMSNTSSRANSRA
jgi:N utilization substance protein B